MYIPYWWPVIVAKVRDNKLYNTIYRDTETANGHGGVPNKVLFLYNNVKLGDKCRAKQEEAWGMIFSKFSKKDTRKHGGIVGVHVYQQGYHKEKIDVMRIIKMFSRGKFSEKLYKILYYSINIQSKEE